MNTPKTETELILPGKDRAGDGFCALGYICRAALAFFCTLAFSFFAADALRSDSIPAGTLETPEIIVVALIATVFFSIMGISKRCFFITGAVGVGIATFALWSRDHLAERFYYCYRAVVSAFFQKLIELGYNYGGMKGFTIIPAEEAAMRRLHTNAFLSLDTAFRVIIVIFAALFCACLLRRVHIIPLVTVGSAVCTLFLYYGMNSSNTGFAMIIAAICGIIALSGYDRVYTDRKTVATATGLSDRRSQRSEVTHARRQSSAMGGFTALGTTIIAALLLVLPSGVDHRMNDITVIATPAAKLENYFLSLINGQSPDFGSLLFSGVSAIDKRSTAFENRSYTGAHIFTIGSDVNLPVYLRNWVGTNYSGDSWTSPSYEEIAAYKQRFGEDFSPEQMTNDLLWAVDEALTGIRNGRTYTSHSDIGYVTARIDIRKFRPTANLIFFPSYSDQRLGLLEYGTKEPLSTDYSNYSDGIFSSTAYVFLDEYSTVANLPLLRDPDFAQNLSSLITEFRGNASELLNIIATASADGTTASDEALASAYEDRFMKNALSSHYPGYDSLALAKRYVYEMDDHERARVLKLIHDSSEYYDYVYSTYLTGCEGFDEFERLARSIIYSDMPNYPDMDSFRARNLQVRKIIDYLSKNMTYTLSPGSPDPDRPYINSAETFLFDTREGYCVQFATSAVMLLRALGIPARYAEGYIADNFERTRGEDPVARYSSPVLDSNAHAWIEVYYDLYGWVLYEATTPYMSDMYDGYFAPTTETDPETGTTDPEETTAPEETTTANETDTKEPEKPEEKQIPTGVISTVVTVVVIAAVIAVMIICLRARAERAEKRFKKLANDAKTSSDAAHELDALLYRLLKLCGLVRMNGEQTADFSTRVDLILGNISPEKFEKVARAIERTEFAPEYSSKDARLVADYCEFLRGYLLRADPVFTRLWRKYILAL